MYPNRRECDAEKVAYSLDYHMTGYKHIIQLWWILFAEKYYHLAIYDYM